MNTVNEQDVNSILREGRISALPYKLSYWRIVIAGLLILCALLGVKAYGYEPVMLAAGISLYAAVLYWRPIFWFLLLPPIMGWLNLSPWSGSFFLEEFDIFILVTVSILIIRNAYSLDRAGVPKLVWIGFGIYFLSWVISLIKGLFPLTTLDANAFSSYYSHYNALRIAKSFLWGMMLWPAISHAYRHSRTEAVRLFGWGMAIAVIGVGIIALWERGVVTALIYSHSIYAIAKTVLNFTTHYRITGLFAEMHTGGEAIDGFLSITLPFALYATFQGSNKTTWLIGALSSILCLYAAAVTFSRTTYLATIVDIVTLAMIYLLYNRRSVVKLSIFSFISISAVLALLALEYKKGGTLLLFSCLVGYAGVIMAFYFFHHFRFSSLPRRLSLIAGVAFGLFATYGAARGMLTSKWVYNEFSDAILIAIILGMAVSIGGALLGTKFAREISVKTLFVILMALVGASAIIIPSLLGYFMESRFSESTRDFNTRWDHWVKSISVMDHNASTYLFGQGLGRFPEVFFWKSAVNEVGMYRFLREGNNQFLELRGGPYLEYGQRIALDENKKYTLSFDARTHDKSPQLRFRICRRNIIEPFDFFPGSIEFKPKIQGNEGMWSHYTWVFNMGKLGNGFELGRKPLMLQLTNFQYGDYMTKPRKVVDVDNISIRDSEGHEYLRNGNFQRGARAWYPYFDISHLPWHTKNFWVALFFGQGFLGVIGMSILMFAALINGIRRIRENDKFAPYLTTALAGFLAVGLFGTLVDVPRIMTLFYIILFSLLMMPRTQNLSALQ